MLSEELKKLKEYLNSNIQQEYIRFSTSKAEYSVIFIFKKNKHRKLIKKQMCVNYRQLNSITKKNQYSLLLIEELQNQLQEVK